MGLPHSHSSLLCVSCHISLTYPLHVHAVFVSMSPQWPSPLARSHSRSLPVFEACCAFPSSWILTLTPFPSDVTEGWYASY